MLAKINLDSYGGDLLTMACQEGKREIVEHFINKGVDIMSPPETCHGDDQYRRTPFVISAAQSGDWDTLQGVCQSGGSLAEVGFICLSKKRKNHVTSNVLGCAAWGGKNLLLKKVIATLKKTIEYEAIEQVDSKSKIPGAFTKEFAGYTPLMLAIARDDENLDAVKTLLQHGANFDVKDTFGNSVIHIAAMNGNNKILDYLTKNLKIDMFSRNKKGESAL